MLSVVSRGPALLCHVLSSLASGLFLKISVFPGPAFYSCCPQPPSFMACHLWYGHAANRADGRESWHARKPLGPSVRATGASSYLQMWKQQPSEGKKQKPPWSRGADLSGPDMVSAELHVWSSVGRNSLRRHWDGWEGAAEIEKPHFCLTGGTQGQDCCGWEQVDPAGTCFPFLVRNPWRATANLSKDGACALVSYSGDHSVPLNLKSSEFTGPTDTDSKKKKKRKKRELFPFN